MPRRDDHRIVSDHCARWAEDLSSDLDGELTDDRRAALAAHLDSCAGCRALAAQLRALHRAVRLRPAELVPDLSERILAVTTPPRSGRGDWIRLSLVAVALTELVLAVPALAGRLGGTSVHVGRHLGSLEAAVALGLLYAAWRPVRAFGLLPLAGALACAFTVTAAADVVSGRAGAIGEAHHLLDVAGVALLWLLAGAPRPWRHGASADAAGRRRFTLPRSRDGGSDALSDAS